MLRTRGLIRSQKGLGLLETMASLGILSIILLTGIPSLADISQSYRRNAVRQQFESQVSYLKSKALAEGARTVLIPSNDGKSYETGIDYIPYNNDGSFDSSTGQFDLPNQITLTLGQQIIFNSRGYLVSSNGEYATTTVRFLDERIDSFFVEKTLLSTGEMHNTLVGGIS